MQRRRPAVAPEKDVARTLRRLHPEDPQTGQQAAHPETTLEHKEPTAVPGNGAESGGRLPPTLFPAAREGARGDRKKDQSPSNAEEVPTGTGAKAGGRETGATGEGGGHRRTLRGHQGQAGGADEEMRAAATDGCAEERGAVRRRKELR